MGCKGIGVEMGLFIGQEPNRSGKKNAKTKTHEMEAEMRVY